MISWACGNREHTDALILPGNLYGRLAEPENAEVITDGLLAYHTAWPHTFRADGTHYVLNKSKGKNEKGYRGRPTWSGIT